MRVATIYTLLAEDNSVAYYFLIAAILVATLTMLIRLYRYQARQKRSSGKLVLPKEPDVRGLRAGAPDAIVRWEVEMQELARDLKAEVDSKMVALGQLIRDADRASGRLEKALGSAPAEAGRAANRQEKVLGSAPAEAGRAANRQEKVLGTTPPKADMPSTDGDPDDDALIVEEVHTLSDYGFSTADIASRLGIPLDHATLIIERRKEIK